MSDACRFEAMFEYLREPSPPTESTGVVVFGRSDERVAQAAGELANRNLVPWMVITGGLGKDSSPELWDQKSSEAKFLGDIIFNGDYNISFDDVYLEPKAATGGDNARLSLKKIEKKDLEINDGSLTAVAHATSLRRLAATLEFEGTKTGQVTNGRINRMPSEYPFQGDDPRDQVEASAELLRLADWPDQGLLIAQPDLPEDLVDLARSVTDTPADIPALQSAVFRSLPRPVRRLIMQRQTGKN